MEYLIKNKEWLFSGIGVLVISLIITFMISRIKKKKTKPKIEQHITSGQKSNNIQTTGDVTVNIGKDHEI